MVNRLKREERTRQSRDRQPVIRVDAILDRATPAWPHDPHGNGQHRIAPGSPGADPCWAPSAKDGVGTALCPASNSTSLVWFTLGRGILTEIFYPPADRQQDHEESACAACSPPQQAEKTFDLVVDLRRVADDQCGGQGPRDDPADGARVAHRSLARGAALVAF